MSYTSLFASYLHRGIVLCTFLCKDVIAIIIYKHPCVKLRPGCANIESRHDTSAISLQINEDHEDHEDHAGKL